MHISNNGLALIQHFEGFSASVYTDAAGHPTIGYGHLILPHEQFPEPIHEQQARALLKQDVRIAEQAVQRLIQTPLQQGQFDALVDFTFNLGSGALQRSTLRRKLNRGEYQRAVCEFPRWVYAGGRKLRGLVRRRQAEQQLFKGLSLRLL